tara:strand:+ start:1528 stop:2379 length:852 start_codon:yes stop_codon:yes gene_type:complete
MSILLNGDCLEELKNLDESSVDLIFCDLPYGQTNCNWDCKIDLDLLWSEILRVKKTNTPIFFTTTTKFGVDLINSSPKKCPFRYDMVWAKSSSTGFLLARKMPMRRHEMIYVFYEKLPFYDLSSHQHKFVKEYNDFDNKDGAYGVIKSQKGHPEPLYDPPLPTSVVQEPEPEPEPDNIYGNPNRDIEIYKKCGKRGRHQILYEPPLPHSLLEVKTSRGKHSTEKPVALMEWILKYYSKEGDVVLDPTMGSGSMGVACKNLNRNFIGIEKDFEIYQVANQRIET